MLEAGHLGKPGDQMDIQERIATLQILLDSPKYIVFPGEIPWQDIQNPIERARARNRQRARMERELHPGLHAEQMRRYYSEHPSILRERGKKRSKTPKGRAALAKHCAKRREHSTDPALYAARVELLHVMQEPCAECHTPYNITHQVDHIIALCLGGTDNWDNLQPLCIECHRKKTAEDVSKLMAVRGNE